MIMLQGLLELYMGYRKNVEKKPDSAPKRIIFFRGKFIAPLVFLLLLTNWLVDGVSEGEYEHVLEIGS